jgi:hypothetical protein
MKGILVHTLRSPIGDCTNRGVSSRETTFLLVGPGVPEVFEPGSTPVLMLDRVKLGEKEYLIARPTDLDGEPIRGMAGGNYVWSSDGRFRRDVCEYPIPVHDRVE